MPTNPGTGTGSKGTEEPNPDSQTPISETPEVKVAEGVAKMRHKISKKTSGFFHHRAVRATGRIAGRIAEQVVVGAGALAVFGAGVTVYENRHQSPEQQPQKTRSTVTDLRQPKSA